MIPRKVSSMAVAELYAPNCIYWFTSEDEHLKTADMSSLRVLGITMKKLRWERGGIDGMLGYYLKLKS